MATKKYLDYEGLARVIENIDKKYAPIAAIIFKGTVDKVEDLPVIADQKAGWMYNISSDGLTTADFVEGAGHEIAAGENVGAVELYTGVYTKVTPSASDDPKARGWYEEDQVTYTDITATLDPSANPKALGLYEQDGGSVTGYVLTNDETVVGGKEYFERSATYKLSQDRLPVAGKDYFVAETEMKWDLLGGIFDLESRYLEFGTEFPQGPADRMTDGRTFLYMGPDKKVYTFIATPEGRPAENGYFEGTFTEIADPSTIVNLKEEPAYEVVTGSERYIEVTPVGTENPQDEGWYEEDSLTPGTYIPTTDTTVDGSKTYYKKLEVYVRTDDVAPELGKTYFSGAFVASVDTTVDPDKNYYSEAALYTKAIIYSYDEANDEWVAQSSGGSGDMIPITDSEIDDLFI